MKQPKTELQKTMKHIDRINENIEEHWKQQWKYWKTLRTMETNENHIDKNNNEKSWKHWKHNGN